MPADGQHSDPTIAWLLDGDPAIRWQVMRDLLDAPAADWQAERRRTLSEGWGARLLGEQQANGRWGEGLYSPKWTSSTYTLMLLRDIGLPPDCAAAQRGTRVLIDGMLGPEPGAAFADRLARLDRCIVGMVLALSVYFRVTDARTEAIVANIRDEIMPDHGWNCRRHRKPHPHHSSFHTTLNVLDGMREYIEADAGPAVAALRKAETAALELLLEHRLFRSDKTGAIIKPAFAEISFPHRWFYDYVRALAHFARAGAPRDRRLGEAIERLIAQRGLNGRWRVGTPHSGHVFFNMEPGREGSRWNTLRALRILRWWNGGTRRRAAA